MMQIYSSRIRYEMEPITEELLADPAYSWMSPPEVFIGHVIVRVEGRQMIHAVIPFEQFEVQFEAITI